MESKMMPLISVIIPIYNIKEYLSKSIDSIINQTYKNIEIILVDDGSTDGSSKICDEYAEMDSRIRVIHKENGGVTSARKAGLLKATGTYVTYVDGDDWMERNAYSVMVEKGANLGADIVQACGIAEYPGGGQCSLDSSFKQGIYAGDRLETEILSNLISVKEFYQNNITINLEGFLLKRQTFFKEQMEIDDNIKFGEDMVYIWGCMMKCNSIAVIEDKLFHYNKRPGSAMHSSTEALSLKYESTKLLYKAVRNAIEKYSRLRIILEKQLDMYIYMLLLTTNYSRLVSNMNDGLFPFENINRGDRLVVYGAGSFGEQIVNYLKNWKNCKLVLWCDLGYEEYRKKGKEVFSPKEIETQSFDKVVIAVTRKKVSREIFMYLTTLGINEKQICEVDISKLVKENLPAEFTCTF